MASVQHIKSRTLVFTLSKGSRVFPKDFLPALHCVRGSIEAFGTVGVNYIWHITLSDSEATDCLFDQGNFKIGGREVYVSRLAEGFYHATLHWIPYWVPHSDVTRSLELLLSGSKVTCSYIKVPQVGYLDCSSAQRSIKSVTSLGDLPHFIHVNSEGESYRAYLFVPGRQPICFQCHSIGHMKDQCTLSTPAQEEDSHPSVEADMDDNKNDVEPREKDEDENAHEVPEYEDSSHPEALDVCYDPQPYRIDVFNKDCLFQAITYKGRTILVNPPLRTQIPLDNVAALASKCENKNLKCCLLEPWNRAQLSMPRLRKHFMSDHQGFRVVADK